MSRLLGSVLLMLALSASGAAAQTAADSAASRELRSTLRNVAGMQEIYYSQHGRYAEDVKVLLAGGRFELGAGITLVLHHASERGWAAEAKHAALRGQSCVMWMGKPDTGDAVFTSARRYAAHEFPGRALCDIDPPPVKRPSAFPRN